MGTNGFKVKIENEWFNVICSSCRQSRPRTRKHCFIWTQARRATLEYISNYWKSEKLIQTSAADLTATMTKKAILLFLWISKLCWLNTTWFREVYFNWNFQPLLTLKSWESWIEEKMKSSLTSLRMQCVYTRLNLFAAREYRAFRLENSCFSYIIGCIYTLKF